ncbi:MAG: hotdog domain-containing protein [Patulibacter sp.]|nr:hotdog domain-containing protein [Patulibacter sp.]
MDLPDAPEFSITCDLRWSDFDRLGHLNQAVYHVLLEQARVAWLNAVRPADLERWQAWVLARVELDYRREVDSTHTQVIAACRPLTLGTSSLVVAHELRHLDGTVAATGSCVLVAWDAKARGKRAFTEGERAAYVG